MIPRWITIAYLAYLAAPIVLLFVGSFGELWLNTLLPTGVDPAGGTPTSPPTRASAARSRPACSSPR